MMNADEPTAEEDQLEVLLAEYDEAMAAGGLQSLFSTLAVPPDLRPRLERDLGCMRFLRKVWPDATPGSASTPRSTLPFGTTNRFHVAEGTRLGRFQIRRELGRGGYGIVFLAHDPELGRDVALKIPRIDALVTPDLRARFHLEARAAASLDHPNVVQVHEAGEVGAISYIASAYCQGVTLAYWLRQSLEPVPIHDAATVVATLADAVQHAHSRGVLHRDLKPANVLLQIMDGGSPETGSKSAIRNLRSVIPKITDFGLAKIQATGGAELTPSGTFLGTPSYMAPEQAGGKTGDISTAVDIYALGAILYELLSGAPPFSGETPLEVLRQVVEREPKPPRMLNSSVDRDLEIICLKCLQKEPGRRYASAQALAGDLQCWLRGEPILGRPVGNGERLLRWCRRKPALASLSAALLLALSVGFAAVAWQWLRADRHAHDAAAQRDLAEASRRKAHGAIDEYFTQVSENKLLGKPGLQNLRKDLLDGALRYYQDFLRERNDDPAMQFEVAATYIRVAIIHDKTDSKEAARSAFQEALTLYEKLARAYPDDSQALAGLARAYNLLGDLYARMTALDQAGACLDQARAILEKLVVEHHDRPEFQSELAKTHRHLASILVKRDQRAAALQAFEQACVLGRGLVEAYPEQAEYQTDLATTYSAKGELHNSPGQWQDALDSFRQAENLLEALARSRPADIELRSKLADNQGKIAEAYRGSGRQVEALRSWQQVRNIRERLAYENPAVTDLQWELALAYSFLGKQYSECEELQQALATWQQAFPVIEKLLRINPNFPDYRHRLADLHNGHGHVYSKMGRRADALRSFEKAAHILEELVHDCPDTALYVHGLAINRHNYGNEARRADRPDEARPALERSRELCLRLIATDPSVLAYSFLLVHVHNQLGLLDKHAKAFDKAARSYRLALDLGSKLHRSQPAAPVYERLLTTCYCNLGELAHETKQLREAESYYRQALDIREKLAKTHTALTGVFLDVASTSCDLAGVCRERNRPKEASVLYEQSLAYCAKALQANPHDMPARSIEAEAWDGIGLVRASSGRPEEALKAHRQAVDIQKAVVAKAPEQTSYRKLLSAHGQHLSEVYRYLGRNEEAAALQRELAQSAASKP